jgi:hypothetical protein
MMPNCREYLILRLVPNVWASAQLMKGLELELVVSQHPEGRDDVLPKVFS